MHCSCTKSWYVRVFWHRLCRKMRVKISPANRKLWGCWVGTASTTLVGSTVMRFWCRLCWARGESCKGTQKSHQRNAREHQHVGDQQGSKSWVCAGTRQDAQEKLFSLTAAWCIIQAAKLQLTSQKPGPSISSRLRLHLSSSTHVKYGGEKNPQNSMTSQALVTAFQSNSSPKANTVECQGRACG